jgi:subtilisin family serine protease
MPKVAIIGAGSINCLNIPNFTNGSLWHLGNNLVNSNIHINYCASRAILSQGSSNIVVAVIDAGVQSYHPELRNVLPGWDAHSQTAPNNYTYMSFNSHGTAVAGFIGAIPGTTAGIATGITILPISFRVNASGNITSPPEALARAFDYAINNQARVINCSWGNNNSSLVADAVKRALDRGCVVVFASGNDNASSISSPANSDPRILVVGAMDDRGARAQWGSNRGSSYGTDLDLVAPGKELITLPLHDPNWIIISEGTGTSLAAPQVAATAAMILSLRPYLTGQEVTTIIERTARKTGGSWTISPRRPWGWNQQLGSGILDVHAALANTECIREFTHQVLSTNTTVNACDIRSREIVVHNGARLTLQAPSVTINGTFFIEPGSSLTIAN